MADSNQDANQENVSAEQEEKNRRLKNLNALFAWASAHGSHGNAASDPSGPSAFDQMEKDRQEFLTDAIKSMTVDVVEEIQRCVNALRLDDGADGAVEKKVDAMEALLDYIEDLNFAEDFQKMGGLELLMFALDSKHDDVVWRAGECLATAVQNEAKLQMYVLELGAIGKVLQLLDETASEKVVLKMIRALSCLASANATVVEVFLSVGGLKTLTAAMERHADRTKVQLKTAFFLAGLPETFNAFAQHASEAGLIEVFVKIVKGSSEAMLWECVLRMLTNLCATSNCCIIDLQKEALNIKGLLGNRSAFIQSLDADDRPGHEEEERHIKQLHTYLAMTVAAVAATTGGGGSTTSPPAAMMQLAIAPETPSATATYPLGLSQADCRVAPMAPMVNKNKIDFEATTEWQPVTDRHILPAGLEIRIDLGTGEKYARETPK